MSGGILELAFRHNTKRALGFELFKLSELWARIDALPTILTPKRLDFHVAYVGIRGKGEMLVDFAPVPIGAGKLVVCARGRIQEYRPSAKVDAWMLMFTPDFLRDRLRVLSPAWAMPVVATPADGLAWCDQMAAEHARPEDAQQAPLLASLLRALLLQAERSLPVDLDADPALERFFTILERDCLATRGVAHYAREAGISPRRLGELVSAKTGRSTKQVIDERVVLEHKRLLAHTTLSVKELAEHTGFAEPTNLVKFFRHHTGTTPAAFRSTFVSSHRRS